MRGSFKFHGIWATLHLPLSVGFCIISLTLLVLFPLTIPSIIHSISTVLASWYSVFSLWWLSVSGLFFFLFIFLFSDSIWMGRIVPFSLFTYRFTFSHLAGSHVPSTITNQFSSPKFSFLTPSAWVYCEYHRSSHHASR